MELVSPFGSCRATFQGMAVKRHLKTFPGLGEDNGRPGFKLPKGIRTGGPAQIVWAHVGLIPKEYGKPLPGVWAFAQGSFPKSWERPLLASLARWSPG